MSQRATGLLRGQKLGYQSSRNPSEDELAMYRAYIAFNTSYLRSQLDDVNEIEAFKSGWRAHARYAQQSESVPERIGPE